MRTVTIKRESFESPCVYEFMRAGKALYVGFSGIGFRRVFSLGETRGLKRARADAVSESDSVQITVCDSLPEAEKLEAKLIHEKHPLYNRQCPVCGRYRVVDNQVISRGEFRQRREVHNADRKLSR